MKNRTFFAIAIAGALASSPLVASAQTLACGSDQMLNGTGTLTSSLGTSLSGDSKYLGVDGGDVRMDVYVTMHLIECKNKDDGSVSYRADITLNGSGEITDSAGVTTKVAGTCSARDSEVDGTLTCKGNFTGTGDYDMYFLTLSFADANACIDGTDSVHVLKKQCAPALRQAWQDSLSAAAPDFADSVFGKAIAWTLANEHVRLRKGY